MKKQTDSGDYAQRMKAIYDRTNEKPILRSELESVFANKRFNQALDVGPGPGLITDVLSKHSDHLTLIEITEDYRQPLTEKFPKAEVIIGSINSVPLTKKYDAILYSQGLYYQKEDEWLSVCKRLAAALNPRGILVIVMCTDSGDFWDIMNYTWSAQPEMKAFYFKKWSEFVPELRTIGSVKEIRFQYDAYCKKSEVVDFIGGCVLAVMDQSLLRKNGPLLQKHCHKFEVDNEDLKFSVGCAIAVVSPNSSL